MNPTALEKFLHEQIPLTKAQGITIVHADETGVRIRAPLSLNHNHMNTAFGGSLSSLLITACYTSLYFRMSAELQRFHLLIKKEETLYRLPVSGDIEVDCALPEAAEYERFLQTLQRKGLARITLTSLVMVGAQKACEFRGEFVAQRF